MHHFSCNASKPLAGAEQSFSKLKLIKNYLRNACGRVRLSSIAISNIEKEQTKNLNIEKIIDNFSKTKSRKDISYNRIS